MSINITEVLKKKFNVNGHNIAEVLSNAGGGKGHNIGEVLANGTFTAGETEEEEDTEGGTKAPVG